MGEGEGWARMPMQTGAWQAAYLEVWPGRVDTVGVDGAAVRLVRRGALWEFLGHELHEPVDALWRDEEAAAALGAELRKRPVLVRRLLADSPLAHAIGARVVRGAGAAPVMHLEGWKLSSRRASDLRRARRRAEQIGPVELEVVQPAEGEVRAAVARFADVERSSWKGEAQTSLAHDDRRRQFYVSYGERAAAAGLLRLAFLRIGEADAAAHLALEWDNVYWLLKMGYDERFARASPGQLLLEEMVEAAVRSGLDRVELLGSTAPWTAAWTSDARDAITTLTFPTTPAGVAAAGVVAARRLRGRA